jgi:hypothetical protein
MMMKCVLYLLFLILTQTTVALDTNQNLDYLFNNHGKLSYGFFSTMGSSYYEEKNTLGVDRSKIFLFFFKVKYKGIFTASPGVNLEHSINLDYFFNNPDAPFSTPDSSFANNNLTDLLNLQTLCLNLDLFFPDETRQTTVSLGLKKQENFLSNSYFENYLYPEKSSGIAVNFFNDQTGNMYLTIIDILNLYQDKYTEVYSFKNFPQKENFVIGDSNDDWFSFRSGVIYQTPDANLRDHYILNFRFSSFFTRYGSVFGGSDNTSFDGDQIQNDYLFHYSASSLLKSGKVKFTADFSAVDGIDRRQPDLFGYSRDISIDGLLARTGVDILLFQSGPFSQNLTLDILYADGPVYNEYNQLTNYGYVGVVSPSQNFPVTGQSWGFSPFAISDTNGISFLRNYGLFHSSGSALIDFKLVFGIYSKLTIKPGISLFFDTVKENTENIFEETKSYPDMNSRYIGNETSIDISISFLNNTVLQLNGGIFTPGKGFKNMYPGLYTQNENYIIMVNLKFSAGF